MLQFFKVSGPLSCADVSASDQHLALGTAQGVLLLLDLRSLALLKTIRLFRSKAIL